MLLTFKVCGIPWGLTEMQTQILQWGWGVCMERMPGWPGTGTTCTWGPPPAAGTASGTEHLLWRGKDSGPQGAGCFILFKVVYLT